MSGFTNFRALRVFAASREQKREWFARSREGAKEGCDV
jgi:hypothetical protein